jgi:D-3-phosphoglycerate dehydrogenase
MSSSAQEIPRANKVSRSVSGSWGNGTLSTSPSFTFHSSPNKTQQLPYHGSLSTAEGPALSRVKSLKPFVSKDIKVLLLENVNESGQKKLRDQGYQVEALKTSLPEDELMEKIR